MSDMGVVASATGVLRLDASGVDRGVDQAGNALGRLTTATNSSYYGLRNLAMGFELVGSAAAGVIGASANLATNWEAGMNRMEVSTFGSAQAIKDHSAAVDQLDAQFQQIASSTPVPIKSIQSVGNEVARLGVRYQDLGTDTQAILDLNQATGVSIDTLTQSVGKNTMALGLGSDGIHRFASDVFALQRQTPATTEDILTLSQRIAGVGAASQISQADVLGIATAVASVGGNVRTNASAITKFIDVIQTSVQTGGAQMQEFARLSGMTAAQFSAAWAKDPGAALAAVTKGLGELNETQGAGQEILQGLGFTQASQIDSLLNVARAQTTAGDSALTMTGALAASRHEWETGNALAGATQSLYSTTSAKLQELRNNVDLAGVSFGSFFLPMIRAASTVLSDLAIGTEQISPGFRDAIGVMLGLVAVVGTVGGALLFILPRFIQARDAVIRLAEAHLEEAGGAAESAVAQGGLAESTQMLLGIMQELLATQLVLIGEYEDLPSAIGAVQASMAGYITVTEEANVVTQETTESMGLMAAAGALLSDALGPIALIGMAVMGVMTLLGGGLVALGAAHKSAADAARDQASADQSLMTALEQESTGVKGATDQWILHTLAQNGSLDVMQKLGLTAQDAINIVKGTADPKLINMFADALQNTAASGGDWASKMAQDVQKVIITYQKSVDTSHAMTKANQEIGQSADATSGSIDGLNGKVETAAQKADKAAQAGQQYAQALLSQANAALSVQRAHVALEQAGLDLQNKTLLIAEAEGKLALSEVQGTKAANDLADAQFTLAHAQEDAQRKVDDANRSLAEAQLGQRQAVQGVADAQERLNKVMDPKESANKLRDAYKELRDAQEALHKGQQTVEDAQWQINYLMHEGASRRDLQDAQDALTDAQNNVADATDKATDAQAKINDLNGPSADRTNELADAQLALEAAQQQVADSASRVATEQENVAKAQLDASNNKALVDAQVAVQQAQNNVTQATIDQSREQEALHQLQTGSLEMAFAGAQNALESALYQQATAIVEVKKQHDEMQGKMWTSKDYAKALGDELITLGNQAGGPVGSQIANMGREVKTAGDNMGDLEDKTKKATTAFQNVGPNSQAAVEALKRAEPDVKHHSDIWGKLWDTIGSVLVAGPAAINKLSGGKIGQFLDWLNPFAEGGIVTRPTLSLTGEAGPELILPLNDPARMQELIVQANVQGLLPSMQSGQFTPPAPAIGAAMPMSANVSSTQISHEYGDFKPTIISNADPDDMMREWEWRNRVVTRQPAGVK